MMTPYKLPQIILLFAVIGLLSACSNDTQTHLEKANLQGKVKKITTNLFAITKGKKKGPLETTSFTYNPDGYLTTSRELHSDRNDSKLRGKNKKYNDQGDVIYEKTEGSHLTVFHAVTYDESGLKIKDTVYAAIKQDVPLRKRHIHSITDYTYNADQLLAEEKIITHWDNEKVYIRKYAYTNGKQTRMTIYLDGEKVTEYRCTYNSDGYLNWFQYTGENGSHHRKMTLNQFGDVTSEKAYSYSKSGDQFVEFRNALPVAYLAQPSKYEIRIKYTYDKQNNWISRTVTSTTDNEKYLEERSIEYY